MLLLILSLAFAFAISLWVSPMADEIIDFMDRYHLLPPLVPDLNVNLRDLQHWNEKPPLDISTREGLFTALLPKVYASKRPRRHGYGPGRDIATILIYGLNLPINELQSLTRNRLKLKEFLKKIENMMMEYQFEIGEGRGKMTPELVLKSKHEYVHDYDGDTEINALRKRIQEIDEEFLLQDETALTMCEYPSSQSSHF